MGYGYDQSVKPTRSDVSRLTCVWVYVVTITPQVHPRRVLLDELHNFINIIHRDIILLQKALGSCVRVL